MQKQGSGRSIDAESHWILDAVRHAVIIFRSRTWGFSQVPEFFNFTSSHFPNQQPSMASKFWEEESLHYMKPPELAPQLSLLSGITHASLQSYSNAVEMSTSRFETSHRPQWLDLFSCICCRRP